MKFVIYNLTLDLFWNGDGWIGFAFDADKFETKEQAVACIKNNEQDDDFSGYILTIWEIFEV